ncbi:MAG: anti-sigma factor family protein [Planctomycetota bacterium]|jgi:hypothetical protein
MKCDEAEALLIECSYQELPPEEEARLREHLAGCDACRRELDALERDRKRLAALAEPAVRVDLGRLYQAAADRGQRGRRRWRRAAVAASAAAAVMVALFAARVRLEWRPGQLSVSFGDPPPVAPTVKPEEHAPSPPPSDPYEKRIETLEEIAGLLSAELTESDARHAAEMADLGRRLARGQRDVAELTRQANLRWGVAEREFQELFHLTSFRRDSSQKGGIP